MAQRARPDPEATASAILTFLIADVRGYTAFTRAHGDEGAARLAAHFAEIAREGVEANGGRVVELRGDEALAVFTSPRAALRAAADLQRTFDEETLVEPALPLQVGIGIDAGEAVPVEEGYRGGALNLAARLCSVAGPGEILASEGVVHLARAVEGLRIEPRPGLELKGLDQPVNAFAIGETAGAGAPFEPHRQGDVPGALDPVTPLFGRDVEARWLRWTWRASRSQRGQVRALLGPHGVGKTRLAAELAGVAARDGATVHYATTGVVGSVKRAIETATATDGPALLILDELESADEAERDLLARFATRGERPTVTLLIHEDDAPAAVQQAVARVAGGGTMRRLGPLDHSSVAGIVSLYAASSSDPAPVQAIAEASGGLPRRIHELAADWAQGEVSRRLGTSVGRAADRRRDLQTLEAEVASNVVDLQLARERVRLYGEVGARTASDCPWKGLASFEATDVDVFFGRERLVAEMVGRLAGTSFLAVVGPSGSGKSSAVRAGLVPALASGALPGAETWTRVLLRPGSQPMRELDRTVFAALDEPTRASIREAADPLAAASQALGADRRLVVVVDQFEEIFTATADEAERDRFIDTLVTSATAGTTTIIVAIRADFYGRCAAHPALATQLGANHVLVGPMSADEYRRVIEGPARRASLRIDGPLVDALVAEVVDEPGALPLLSTAMVELWEHREGRVIRMSAYAATSGVRGAVGRLAEGAFGRLSEAQQGIARSIFLRLAAGEGDTVARRRVALTDFDVDINDDVRATLRTLTEARLLTVDEGTVEVAHEALLREWPRLADWLEEDREGRRLRAHLADTAREWEAGGRDPGELYRGARLASTLDWTTDHTLELNESERRFVAESRAAAEAEAGRQRRTNRRLRVLLGASVVGLVVAIGAGGYALVQQGQAERAAAEATMQRAEAETQRTAAEEAATAADAQRLGALALAAKDFDLSLLLASQGYALDDSEATRSNLLAALTKSPAAIGVWRPLPGRLCCKITATPDGRTLSVENNAGQQAVLDAATGATRWIHQDGPDDRLGYAATNDTFLVLRRDPTRVALLDLADGTERREIVYPGGDVGRVHWSPDLTTLTSTTRDGTKLTIWDAASGEPIDNLTPPTGTTFLDVFQVAPRHLVAFLHEGPLPDPGAVNRAFEEEPKILAWYEPGKAAPTSTFRIGEPFLPFAVSPDLRQLALGNEPDLGSITLYDLATGEGRPLRGRHTGRVQGIAFSPDSRLLGSGGDDNAMIAWDVETGELRETFNGHNGRLFEPAFREADGKLTAFTSSLDGSVIGWDVSGERRLGRPFTAGAGNEYGIVDDAPLFDSLPAFATSPDGSLHAFAQHGGVVIRDAGSGAVVRELPVGGHGATLDVAWSPDGSRLAVAGSGDSLVQLWDTATWSKVGEPLAGPASRIAGPASRRKARATDEVDPSDPAEDGERANFARAVAFSPDGRTIVAGIEDGTIWTWDVATAAPSGEPIEVGWPVYDVAFDPEGAHVAAAFNEFHGRPGPQAGKASVFDLATRRAIYTVSVDDDYGRAGAVGFSPDGSMLATGGGKGDLRFWDAQTGAMNGQGVIAAAGWILSLDWHPTEPVIVTGGTDDTVRLIDVERRVQTSRLPVATDQGAVNAAFTPDGRHVVAVQPAPTRLNGFDWSIDAVDWAAHACTVAGRALTEEEWDLYLPDRPYEPACS